MDCRPAGEQALASALITTVQLFATAFGAALAGMVANVTGLTDPGGISGTMSAAGWLFAVLHVRQSLALSLPCAWFGCTRQPGRSSRNAHPAERSDQ